MSSAAIELYRNPWESTMDNRTVVEFLKIAGDKADDLLATWIEDGKVARSSSSFAAVILDPVRPRSAVEFKDRVLATVEIGPKSARYLSYAAAKADVYDRHGVPNRELVASYSHCLNDDDLAWGGSAEYDRAIGGGSGLSEQQDTTLVRVILRSFVDNVRHYHDAWLAERRQEGGQDWYNSTDEPGAEYAFFMDDVRPIAGL
jgi:hypothetical protein